MVESRFLYGSEGKLEQVSSESGKTVFTYTGVGVRLLTVILVAMVKAMPCIQIKEWVIPHFFGSLGVSLSQSLLS